MRLIPRRLSIIPHVREHNWLIHDLMMQFLRECASTYARGILVDIGCGQKPWAAIFGPHVSKYIGVDLPSSAHGLDQVDIVGSAYDTTLSSSSCDIILCTEVLEHLEEPQLALEEMSRILKDGGVVIVTVPFFWHLHEEPRDFFRYTCHGLRYLFERARFEVLEIRPLTGFLATFVQLGIYRFRLQRLPLVGRPLNFLLQLLALSVNRRQAWLKRGQAFSNLYGLVARKR